MDIHERDYLSASRERTIEYLRDGIRGYSDVDLPDSDSEYFPSNSLEIITIVNLSPAALEARAAAKKALNEKFYDVMPIGSDTTQRSTPEVFELSNKEESDRSSPPLIIPYGGPEAENIEERTREAVFILSDGDYNSAVEQLEEEKPETNEPEEEEDDWDPNVMYNELDTVTDLIEKTRFTQYVCGGLQYDEIVDPTEDVKREKLVDLWERFLFRKGWSFGKNEDIVLAQIPDELLIADEENGFHYYFNYRHIRQEEKAVQLLQKKVDLLKLIGKKTTQIPLPDIELVLNELKMKYRKVRSRVLKGVASHGNLAQGIALLELFRLCAQDDNDFILHHISEPTLARIAMKQLESGYKSHGRVDWQQSSEFQPTTFKHILEYIHKKYKDAVQKASPYRCNTCLHNFQFHNMVTCGREKLSEAFYKENKDVFHVMCKRCVVETARRTVIMGKMMDKGTAICCSEDCPKPVMLRFAEHYFDRKLTLSLLNRKACELSNGLVNGETCIHCRMDSELENVHVPFFHCMHCRAQYCRECHVPMTAHFSKDCEEVSTLEVRKVIAANKIAELCVRAVTVKCEVCSSLITKVSGAEDCNKLGCPRCRSASYCFNCKIRIDSDAPYTHFCSHRDHSFGHDEHCGKCPLYLQGTQEDETLRVLVELRERVKFDDLQRDALDKLYPELKDVEEAPAPSNPLPLESIVQFVRTVANNKLEMEREESLKESA